MAVGLLLAGIGLMLAAQVALSRTDAGALLLVCAWGCVSARPGIWIEHSSHPPFSSLAVSALLRGGYEVPSPFLA